MSHSKPLVWALAPGQMVCLVSLPVAHAQDSRREMPKQLVFSATPGTKGILYKIEGTNVSDPLRGFGKAIEKYGDVPVPCLVDSRLPIIVVGNAAAMAAKAGFRNVRSFAMDHSTGKVSEIKFGPWTAMPN